MCRRFTLGRILPGRFASVDGLTCRLNCCVHAFIFCSCDMFLEVNLVVRALFDMLYDLPDRVHDLHYATNGEGGQESGLRYTCKVLVEFMPSPPLPPR